MLSEGLAETLRHLEGRIGETMNKLAEGEISDRDGEHFYRLLGAYRGVSEALVGIAGSTNAINWGHWREARF